MRLKDWKVEELIEHRNFVEKFYNAAEFYLPPRIRVELEEIIDLVQLQFANRIDDNSRVREELLQHGWRKEVDIGGKKTTRIDFGKEGVGLEVQLRQDTNLLHNLLGLQLGCRKKTISCGIIMTYDATTVGIVGQHSMNASIQALDRLVQEYHEVLHFAEPLWVVGLRQRTRVLS